MRCFADVDPEVLADPVDGGSPLARLVQCLADCDQHVREASLDFLRTIDEELLLSHAPAIAVHAAHVDSNVRVTAQRAAQLIRPQDLKEFNVTGISAEAFVDLGASDASAAMRLETLEVVGRLNPAEHGTEYAYASSGLTMMAGQPIDPTTPR